MASAGIWIIWDHCVLWGGGARAKHLEAGRKGLGRARSIEEHWGRGGQVGQVEPAAGVGTWETDDRQASFVRAGAMPGLLALERTVGSDVSWTVRHGPSRNPKGGGGGGGEAGALGKPPAVGGG
jgi:hypothetical protein